MHAVESYVHSRPDLFESVTPLCAGNGIASEELSALEAEVGVTIPAALREATLALAGTQWAWALREELEEEWDADVTGALGGVAWLTPEEMRSARARLARVESALDTPVLPFVEDVHGAASWLALARIDGEIVVLQAGLDGEPERWNLSTFLDDWSRGGFRVEERWEDQPESIVEHLREALELPPRT